MTLNSHTPEIERWLTENGWSPSRDIGGRADELIALRVRQAADQGRDLAPVEAATRIIRSYGELEFPYPDSSPPMILQMYPTVTFRGDAEQFAELAGNIGRPVFPVAYETYERGIWLVDDSGRFFYLHHTGNYFLGNNEYEAFQRARRGNLEDAEDYYV